MSENTNERYDIAIRGGTLVDGSGAPGKPGDLAIWDERATVHRGLADHYPQPREVRRCVIDGDRPFG